MGTWATDNVDVDRAKYYVSASLDGVTTCGITVRLVSTDANETIPPADAETVLDAVLAALANDPDITIYSTTRDYSTYQSYTP